MKETLATGWRIYFNQYCLGNSTNGRVSITTDKFPEKSILIKI